MYLGAYNRLLLVPRIPALATDFFIIATGTRVLVPVGHKIIYSTLRRSTISGRMSRVYVFPRYVQCTDKTTVTKQTLYPKQFQPIYYFV